MITRLSILKVLVGCLIISSFTETVSAQYFYRDIILTSQNRDNQQLFKKNKVTQIELKSFEANGEPTERFVCEQNFNSTYSVSRTFTNGELTGPSSLTSYYNGQGQLYRTVDSSRQSMSTNDYKYDSLGRVIQITNNSFGYGDKVKETEVHLWSYNSRSCPEKMLRIKNGSDSTTVKFNCDDKGNVIDEESFWRGASRDKIYYYYDSSNHLTDIVRYNERAKKLLPDYIFEYDGNNQLTQMITVQQGSSDYLTWRYNYNEKGLKTKEICYDKQKQLLGRIEYEYELKK
ncbi:MAG: hypothetical protein C5B52_08680 [Bacteroidetes bacterium]|nr:MAG: hypothetical protein C5B52_08680 [Bacteroidota bacterium]